MGTSLYFVARGDGSHVFSDDLDDHNSAVREFQLKRRADYRSSPAPQAAPEVDDAEVPEAAAPETPALPPEQGEPAVETPAPASEPAPAAAPTPDEQH
ncbi:YceG-like family protein [compost metagenome]